jgi:peptidylprolyl isomerase
MSTAAHDIMVLETTQGPVKIEMRPDLAPQHVARITELVQSGFYDGIVFHRVIEGFMAQTGCPHGTGTGGSGVKLKAEFNTAPHVRGTASMARAQNPDSGDSQFFICFDDARFLDRQYTVWGQVISGMENVDKIKRGEPVRDPDKIVKAYMEVAAAAAAPAASSHADESHHDEAEEKPAKKPAAKKTATKKPAAKKAAPKKKS